MDIDDRFAGRANHVEDLPEPFRSTLLERLSPQDSIHVLAFNPWRTRQGVRSPGTLLALTDSRWLVVSDDETGMATAVECAYDDTLLVELSEILLRGQLKIDFLAGGEAQACAIKFDSAMDELYREAVRGILRGVEGGTALALADRPAAAPAIEMRPIVFRNAVPKILAEGRRPIGAVQWPAVDGWYGRELAPAAALLATDRELVLIAEKRAWVRWPRQVKYGYIATYFPLVRLSGFAFRRHERFITLDLEMRTSHGGETLPIIFPPEREQDLTQVLECVRRQSAESFSKRGVS
jgi:hypothetical protein